MNDENEFVSLFWIGVFIAVTVGVVWLLGQLMIERPRDENGFGIPAGMVHDDAGVRWRLADGVA